MMKRYLYDEKSQKYGQCYKCNFDPNFGCTQIYLLKALRLVDVCSKYCHSKSVRFIYRVENYVTKKV